MSTSLEELNMCSIPLMYTLENMTSHVKEVTIAKLLVSILIINPSYRAM